MSEQTERDFLMDVQKQIGTVLRKVEERAGEQQTHPDLEALLRLAHREANRRAKDQTATASECL